MRTVLRLFVLTALLGPVVAFAARELPPVPRSVPLQNLQAPTVVQTDEQDQRIPSPPAVPKLCNNASVTVPNNSKTFGLSADTGKQIKEYLGKTVNCGSVCIDEDITVEVGFDNKVTVKIQPIARCGNKVSTTLADAKANNRGCTAKGQKQPTVTIHVPAISAIGLPAKNIGPKSRCNPAVADTLDSIFGRFSGTPDVAGLKSDMAQLDSLPSEALPNTAGTDALTKVLTNLGVDPAQAAKAVNDNPTAALDFVTAAEAKDTQKMQEAADKAGITLNADVKDMIVALTPDQFQEKIAPFTEYQRDAINGQVTGLGQSPEAAPDDKTAGIADKLAPMCDQLGGCGDACSYNPNRLTCRTNNPGALTCGGNYSVCGSIAARYGGVACGQSNNTACFPSLEQGLAAQAALLTGSRYFGGQNPTILSAICNAYASNSAGNDCSAYASFVSRYSGIPLNQTIDPNNAEQVGRVMMAMSRYENGNGVMFSPQQLENALKLTYGGVLPDGTPGFTPGFMQGPIASAVRFSSPFDMTSGYSPAGYGSIGSPFAQVNPLQIGYGSGAYPSVPQTIAQPAQPVGQVSTIAQPAGSTQTQPLNTTQSTSTLSIAGQQLQQALGITTKTQEPPYYGPPAATIDAEPKSVARGGAVIVSWSSVGMRASLPCQVFINDSYLVAEGNNGSKRVETGNSSTAGPLRVAIRCVTSNGQLITSSDSVSVY